VQKPLTSGPHGWPAGQTPWPAGPTLQLLTGWLGGDALLEAVIRNPRPAVGGGRAPWSVAQPTTGVSVTHPGTPISIPL
jgi:hypothetical protein